MCVYGRAVTAIHGNMLAARFPRSTLRFNTCSQASMPHLLRNGLNMTSNRSTPFPTNSVKSSHRWTLSSEFCFPNLRCCNSTVRCVTKIPHLRFSTGPCSNGGRSNSSNEDVSSIHSRCTNVPHSSIPKIPSNSSGSMDSEALPSRTQKAENEIHPASCYFLKSIKNVEQASTTNIPISAISGENVRTNMHTGGISVSYLRNVRTRFNKYLSHVPMGFRAPFIRAIGRSKSSIDSRLRKLNFQSIWALNGGRNLRRLLTNQALRIRSRPDMLKLRKRLIENSQKAKHGITSLIQKYGYIGIGTYFGVYFAFMGGFYVAISKGIFSSEDAKRFIRYFHLENHVDMSKLDSVDTWWGRLTAAWVACKVVEPPRAMLAIAITPSVARFLWRRGLVLRPSNTTNLRRN